MENPFLCKRKGFSRPSPKKAKKSRRWLFRSCKAQRFPSFFPAFFIKMAAVPSICSLFLGKTFAKLQDIPSFLMDNAIFRVYNPKPKNSLKSGDADNHAY